MNNIEHKIHDAVKELALLKFISFNSDSIASILEHIPEDLPETMEQRIQKVARDELNIINEEFPALQRKKDECDQLLPERDQLIRWYVRDCLEDQDGRITKRMIELENDYLRQRTLYGQLELWQKKFRTLVVVLQEFSSELDLLEKENHFKQLEADTSFALLMEAYERLVIASIKQGGFAYDNIFSEKTYEWDSYYPIEWELYRDLRKVVAVRSNLSLIKKRIKELLEVLYELDTDYGYEKLALDGKQIDYWEEKSSYS